MNKIFLTYIFLILSSSSYSQTLDYARDIFFFEGHGQKIKDFYYYYSPLGGHIQNYEGRGLNVVLSGKPGSSMMIGTSNIKLDVSNYGYLRDLKIIQEIEKLKKHINTVNTDVLIIEEGYKNEIEYLAKSKNIDLIVFKGVSSINKQPEYDKEIPSLWHYSFKLNSISRELRQIWRARETYRNFYLYASKSKDYLIFYKNFFWLSILIFLVLLVSLYGFYLRWNCPVKIKFSLMGTLSLFLILFFTFYLLPKFNRLNKYYEQVQNYRVGNIVKLNQSIQELKNSNKNTVFDALAHLKTLASDSKNELFFLKNKKSILAIIKSIDSDEKPKLNELCNTFKVALESQFKKEKLKDYYNKYLSQLETDDELQVTAALRALTEISMDKKTKTFIRNNEKEIFDKLKKLIFHEDPRVRMWVLTLIEKNENYDWLKFMIENNVRSDSSYLVRSRYVRNLEIIQKTETLTELRHMLKKEKHPYVLGEIKLAFLQRGILSP